VVGNVANVGKIEIFGFVEPESLFMTSKNMSNNFFLIDFGSKHAVDELEHGLKISKKVHDTNGFPESF